MASERSAKYRQEIQQVRTVKSFLNFEQLLRLFAGVQPGWPQQSGREHWTSEDSPHAHRMKGNFLRWMQRDTQARLLGWF